MNFGWVGLNLTSGCELSFSEKGWLENGSRVRYLVWEKGYTSKVCDGSTACLDLYLGKLWCSISEFTASEKTPLPACSSYNVFQMTSCPTWSFVCSVVRKTSVSQLLHTQHASLCAPLAKEDVDLDEVVHYLPD